MKPVIVSQTDVNSKSYKVVSWYVDDESHIEKGKPIASLETSKSVFDVEAPEEGLVLRACETGVEIPLESPLAHLFTDKNELQNFRDKIRRKKKAAGRNEKTTYHATVKAEKLASKHKISLSKMKQKGLITSKDVNTLIAQKGYINYSRLPKPLQTKGKVERVLLLGGGLAATQVIDIFSGHSKTTQAVAILDDDPSLWGKDHYGIPIIGGTDRLKELKKKKSFDTAIVTISTSIPVRTKFRELCEMLGIPLTNAIDKSTRIGKESKIGKGNVICALCHFGAGAEIGDNNFISAYNSFDHHCKIGSDISTGPGCIASGIVTIGDRVRMGAGIFIQPHLDIGSGVQIASGSIIVQNIPPDHAVKTKTVSTTIVPL